MLVATAFWQRLDSPGHDACRLEHDNAGYCLAGTAVFLEKGKPVQLSYHVRCDHAWVTQAGRVAGWVGDQLIQTDIVRSAIGLWTLNNVAVTHLEACFDLDLGFTPATNLLQLRRIALATGQTAAVPVAWLDAESQTLGLLSQRYERYDDHQYWYEAAQFNYAAVLQVASTGFISHYPDLWAMQS